jgi:hypothetical protein
MLSFFKKKKFSPFHFAFSIGFLLLGCSGGAMGPTSLGGPTLNNAATPGMPTGVSAPSTGQYGGKNVALLLEGDIVKNPPSQDPNSSPYHTHMKGTLNCKKDFAGTICYGGRVFRMVDPAHEKFLDIQTNSDEGKATFEISFDSEIPNLDDYEFYYTPTDYSPQTQPPLALLSCPAHVCEDPGWDAMHVYIVSEAIPRSPQMTSPTPTPMDNQVER